MTGDIPYFYIKRNGRCFFELGKGRADKVGMKSSYPLGSDITAAKKSALDLYNEWLKLSGKPQIMEEKPKYKRGTVAHLYARFKQTETWKRKKLATVKEWNYYWPYIENHLGDVSLNRVTPTVFEKFYMSIEREHGPDIRWRVVKISRALFNDAVKRQLISSSPCMILPNTKPKPRNQMWIAREVIKLIQTAQDNNYEPMALALRVAWETLLSPVDIRTLPRKALKSNHDGYFIETERTKTGKQAYGALSDDLGKDLTTYIEGLGFDLLPHEPILRTRRDRARYTKARFGSDFSAVRKLAFGPDEKRFFMDIRRSGNVEADLGGASADDRAEILANALHKDAYLEQTYTPPTVAKARKLAKQREIGRALLEQESRNAPRHSQNKVENNGK